MGYQIKRMAATMLLASAVSAVAVAAPSAGSTGCAEREVRVSDVSVAEGDAGEGTLLRFLVTGNGCKMGSVAYSTAAATGARAWPGADYVSGSGTLTWAQSDPVAVRVIEVPVLGDADEEPDEVLWIELSGPSGAVIADPVGVGTILDDDSVIDASEPDCPDSGTFICEVPVFSSRTTARDVTVHFATIDVTASAGSDYVGVPFGSITIAAGTNVARIKIVTRLAGAGKQFEVRIFDPSRCTVGVSRQRVTIPLY